MCCWLGVWVKNCNLFLCPSSFLHILLCQRTTYSSCDSSRFQWTLHTSVETNEYFVVMYFMGWLCIAEMITVLVQCGISWCWQKSNKLNRKRGHTVCMLVIVVLMMNIKIYSKHQKYKNVEFTECSRQKFRNSYLNKMQD